jgi:hypothetical protein
VRPLALEPWRNAGAAIFGAGLIFARGASAGSDLCGQTITESVTLAADQTSAEDGLVVGADGITIDLGGHTIAGDMGTGDVGIDLNGHSDVTIRNGTVRNFEDGIAYNGTPPAPPRVALSRVTVRNNARATALASRTSRRSSSLRVPMVPYPSRGARSSAMVTTGSRSHASAERSDRARSSPTSGKGSTASSRRTLRSSTSSRR